MPWRSRQSAGTGRAARWGSGPAGTARQAGSRARCWPLPAPRLPPLWWYCGGMAEKTVNTTLRLDPDLHARLTAVARRNHRSLHSQVLAYVERGLDQDQEGDGRAMPEPVKYGEHQRVVSGACCELVRTGSGTMTASRRRYPRRRRRVRLPDRRRRAVRVPVHGRRGATAPAASCTAAATGARATR